MPDTVETLILDLLEWIGPSATGRSPGVATGGRYRTVTKAGADCAPVRNQNAIVGVTQDRWHG